MARSRSSRTRARSPLARIRLERGLTQRELADRAGIPIASYRRLERVQVSDPRLRPLVNLSIVLDVPLAEILHPIWRDWSGRRGAEDPRR